MSNAEPLILLDWDVIRHFITDVISKGRKLPCKSMAEFLSAKV